MCSRLHGHSLKKMLLYNTQWYVNNDTIKLWSYLFHICFSSIKKKNCFITLNYVFFDPILHQKIQFFIVTYSKLIYYNNLKIKKLYKCFMTWKMSITCMSNALRPIAFLLFHDKKKNRRSFKTIIFRIH